MFRYNRWSFQKLLMTGFVVIVAFFLSLVFLTYRSIQDYLTSVNWVTHTYQVGESLDQTMAQMQGLTTQQRGYVLTGEPVYRQRYQRTMEQVDSSIRQVERLIRDNAVQKDHFHELLRLRDERNTLSMKNMDIRDREGASAAVTINRLGRDLESLRISERQRNLINTMKEEEAVLLQSRTEQAKKTVQNSLALLASLFFLVLLFLGAFYILLTRENQQRLWAEGQLREMNEHLEQLVEERTRSIYAEQKRTKAILESSLDAIISIDAQSRIVEWNPSAERIFGYPRAQAMGQVIAELIIPERLRQEHYEGFALFLKTGQERILNRLLELPAIKADGTEFPVELSISNMEIEGQPYFTSMVRDITRRKRAQEELLESEARFRTMADSAPVMIWQSGPDGLCTYFNQGWLNFTGRRLEQELGNGWAERVHPDDIQFCLDTYHTAFNAREPFHMEYRLQRHDGEYRWISDTGIPRFTMNHEFMGFIGTCQDVTERREMTEELERRVTERTAQLEAVNKELESFSYSVSHDLRAPLRGIDGFSMALLEDYHDRLDAEGQEYLSLIRKETQRMAQLIDDLLNLSRLTRGELVPEKIDLSQMVRDVGEGLRRLEPDRQIDFKVQDQVMVYGDPRLLHAALQNLLSNAWKFTSHHLSAHIEFGVQQNNGNPVYFVKDDGAGFDMNYKSKLFGAFQRLHQAREFPGTGVGLATVQRIIHRHGGEIWAEGAIEKGATMYFTLGNEENITVD